MEHKSFSENSDDVDQGTKLILKKSKRTKKVYTARIPVVKSTNLSRDLSTRYEFRNGGKFIVKDAPQIGGLET